MSRGQVKEVGDRFTNQNGYTYEKTADRGWVPVHVLIAEARLGRLMTLDERAYFIDGKRSNLAEDNIGIKITYSKQSPRGRLIALDADIQDLKDKLEDLLEQRRKLSAEIVAAEV